MGRLSLPVTIYSYGCSFAVVIFYELVPASQLPFILMAILMGLLQLCLWLFL